LSSVTINAPTAVSITSSSVGLREYVSYSVVLISNTGSACPARQITMLLNDLGNLMEFGLRHAVPPLFSNGGSKSINSWPNTSNSYINLGYEVPLHDHYLVRLSFRYKVHRSLHLGSVTPHINTGGFPTHAFPLAC